MKSTLKTLNTEHKKPMKMIMKNEIKESPITKDKKDIIHQSVKDVFAGAVAGAFAKTATAPIERVKLVMQLRGSIEKPSLGGAGPTAMKVNGAKNSVTAWTVTKSIYYEEGIIAFWRGEFMLFYIKYSQYPINTGYFLFFIKMMLHFTYNWFGNIQKGNTPNVVRQGGAAALNFLLMDWYKATIKPVMELSLSVPSHRPHELREKRRKILSSFLSGGLAGGTTTTVLYPIEFMRTRLALDLGTSSIVDGKQTRKYPRGMRDVFFSIWKSDGIRGLYQGYGIALSGVVVYRALHLGGFDACKTELLYRRQMKKTSTAKNDNKTITMWERVAIAQIVSIVAGTICYPIDSVRRRLMMQAGVTSENRCYRGSIHAFQRIWTEEGLRGFYLGIGPNLFRSVGAALLLVTYDVFKDII